VFVTFIVNTDGSLEDVVIAKGLSPEYNQGVLRVAQSMPNWILCSQSGKLIRVKYILRMEFLESITIASKQSPKNGGITANTFSN
jgi:protein TonB